nr:MAG TPA: Baseplate wedge protein [Caudoviricetes sp.]
MAGLTRQGLVTLRYQQVFDSIRDSVLRNISPNLDVSEDSELGLFLASIARGIADNYDILSEVYDAGTIDKAEGFNLDDLVALNAIYRYVAQPTRGQAEFTGVSGTTVPSTTRLRSTSGDIFYPDGTFTLSPSYCVEANLEVNALVPDKEYVIIIDNVISKYTVKSSDKIADVLKALAGLINGGINAKAEVTNNDTNLRIYKDEGDIIARTNPMVVTATSYLSFTRVTAIRDVYAAQAGYLLTLAGTLIEVETTVEGLDSVYNRYDLRTGREEETDTELRQRYLESLIVAGVGTLDSIVAAVKRVDGVSEATGIENDTEEMNAANIPAKSFKIVVVGGQNDKVAQAIWDTKPAGIRSFGAIFGTAYDIGGLAHNVYFSRPTPKYVFVKVTYSIYDEEVLSTPEENVNAAIIKGINDYGKTLRVGFDIIPNRIYGHIYENISGIIIDEIKVAVSDSQTKKPEDTQYSSEKVVIGEDEYTVWESSQYTISKGV